MRAWAAVAGVAVVTIFPACADSSERATPAREDVATSSPISPGPAPPGYDLAGAGLGDQPQRWGDDMHGSNEPLTVLAPDGRDAQDDGAVVVSVTGFEGNEGGFAQAAASYLSDARDDFSLDGQRAIYSPPGSSYYVPDIDAGDPKAAELLVTRGEDLAVRVRGRGRSKADLVALSDRVAPAVDHREAPAVDVPRGLKMVGRVDADVGMCLEYPLDFRPGTTPGPPGAHSLIWRRGDRETLALYSLPATRGDVGAALAFPLWNFAHNWRMTAQWIAGADAVLLQRASGSGSFTIRAVVTKAPWGDLLIAVAHGEHVPTASQLVAMVTHTTRTDPATWNGYVDDANSAQ